MIDNTATYHVGARDLPTPSRLPSNITEGPSAQRLPAQL